MLMVKTKVMLSEISGLGLFADEFIPKGTLIWKFQPGFDLAIDEAELEKLSPSAREQFIIHSYVNPRTGKYILCFDNARYYNHSDNPNSIDVPSEDGEGIDVAGRDIQPGEEITCNYKDFDAHFTQKLGENYSE